MISFSERFCALSRPVLCALLAGFVLSAPSVDAALVYALTDENDLLTFDSGSPEDLISAGPINGLQGADLVGIDIRPSNGLLYGVTNTGFIYQIDPNSRNANPAGQAISLSGSRYGVDFDPDSDHLRVVSDSDQNAERALGPGSTIDHTPLQYGPGQPGATGDNPNVVGLAFTNSFGFGPSTAYVIDVRTNEDRLAILNPLNSGTLTVVGPLGINASSLQGFDITSRGGLMGFAAMQPTDDGISRLYLINLNTGAATLIGDIGGGDLIDGLAVVDIPEPAAFSLAALATVGGLTVLRRRF